MRRRYGITAAQADAMSAAQGGLCAICRAAPAEHVDHDHATNRVRGLLCFNCNGALGQFRDRTDLMLRAIAYLNHGDAETAADLPSFHFGVFVGELPEPGPVDEPEDDAADNADDDPAAA